MKTVFYDGKVYTGKLPLMEAFAVENGLFFAAGSNEALLKNLGPKDRKIDLQGRFVCAGFNDSHMHLLNFGRSLYSAQLSSHTRSLKELLDHLSAYLSEKDLQPGEWLTGRGWNQDYFRDADRMPDRHDLDRVSREIPIRITRACGHSCVVNTRALSLAGIDKNTPDPEGGTIGREPDGTPDGRLFENAIELIASHEPLPGREKIREMLLLAMKAVNRYGITSVQTDDYGTFKGVSWQLINEVYQELEQEGLMTVRVTEQCNFSCLQDLKAFIEAGNVTGKGSAFFRIGPLKILGDGSLGSRTAHLSMPYLGSQEQGFSLLSPEEMKEMICYANRHDMQTAVHAIGDACLDEVLDAVEAALQKCPREDHRHGIIHCQISRKDQLDRMAALKMHVYAQSIFLDYDNHIVTEIVPEELARTSYSWKTLLNKGLSVSNGSDCPVELPNVMAGIRCAVTRCSLDGTGPYLPDQAFTVQEALDSFTVSGARASFEETIKGSIQPGMLADFVVLGGDPFETPAEELHRVAVEEVWLGGRRLAEQEKAE